MAILPSAFSMLVFEVDGKDRDVAVARVFHVKQCKEHHERTH